MARRLVEAGVNLVQVNLGNNETWDTHGNAFPHLKDKLFPPTDRAVSALLDDLHASGLLDSTLIVMAGEFGRTPRISTLAAGLQAARPRPLGPRADGLLRRRRRARRPGRRLVGQDRRLSRRPTRRRPRTWPPRSTTRSASPPVAAWHDALDRPHHVYHGDPIRDWRDLSDICPSTPGPHRRCLCRWPGSSPREPSYLDPAGIDPGIPHEWTTPLDYGPPRGSTLDPRPDASPITVMIYRIHRTGVLHLNKPWLPECRVKFALPF